MAWVRLDDAYYEDDKLDRAGPLAELLWVRSLAWCNNHQTDGVLTRSAARRLADFCEDLAEIAHDRDDDDVYRKDCDAVFWQNLVDRLIKSELWQEHPGGFEVVNYLAFQRSAEEIRELSRKRAEAGRAGATAKHGAGKASPGREQDAGKPLANDEHHHHPNPKVPTQSSSSLTEGRPQAVDMEEVERLFADKRVAAAHDVVNPKAYRAKVLKNVSEEEREQVLEWHRDFDVTAEQLATAWASGVVPASWTTCRRPT